MRHKDLFKTYIWLLETVNSHAPVSLEEIGRLWLKSSLSDGSPMARSTFNRHREAIEDIFGISITCDRSGGCRYSIASDSNSRHAGSSVQNWMTTAISVSNLISDSRSVHSRILLEAIPSEGFNLHRAVEAMKQSRLLRISYRKYHTELVSCYELEPYCIKLYHRRWYLLARKPETKEYRIFAFDRIVDTAVTATRFRVDRKFDAAAYFKDCFGVNLSADQPAQTIVLRAYGTQQYYMRDLPVHHSQRYLTHGDGFTDYELRLQPTDDFMAYLLSCGPWIQVISPASLAERLLSSLEDTRRRYGQSDVCQIGE